MSTHSSFSTICGLFVALTMLGACAGNSALREMQEEDDRTFENETAYIAAFCKNDPMVGQVEGVRLDLEAKRNQLTEVSAKLSAERYTKLSQELKNYTAEWQLLSQLSQTSCRDLAACNYRTRNDNSLTCDGQRESQRSVTAQIITLSQNVRGLKVE